MGTNETGSRNLECSKHDYIALEVKAKGTGHRWHVLDSSSEGEGLDERWMHPLGQQTVAQPVLTTGVWLLQPLRIEEKMAST